MVIESAPGTQALELILEAILNQPLILFQSKYRTQWRPAR
jgi:hypothetical protein